MMIHLMQIPQGGILHLEGEEDAEAIGLSEADAEPVGPLRYSLDAGLSGGGLFVSGWLRLRVRFCCVVTLEPFEQDIEIENFAVQRELDGSEQVDLTPEVREDIHLALPAHPRSAAARDLNLSATTDPLGGQNPDSWGSPWEALDQIKTQHETHHGSPQTKNI